MSDWFRRVLDDVNVALGREQPLPQSDLADDACRFLKILYEKLRASDACAAPFSVIVRRIYLSANCPRRTGNL